MEVADKVTAPVTVSDGDEDHGAHVSRDHNRRCCCRQKVAPPFTVLCQTFAFNDCTLCGTQGPVG